MEVTALGVPLLLPSRNLYAEVYPTKRFGLDIFLGSTVAQNIRFVNYTGDPLRCPNVIEPLQRVYTTEMAVSMFQSCDYYLWPSPFFFDSMQPIQLLSRIDEILADTQALALAAQRGASFMRSQDVAKSATFTSALVRARNALRRGAPPIDLDRLPRVLRNWSFNRTELFGATETGT